MKKYIKASFNDYDGIYRKIVNYFTEFATDNGATYATCNDYSVEPDWYGGGIRFTLQWDGNAPSEDKVGRAIESYFGSGISYSDAWGKWDHQIMVHVAEYRCR